MGSATASRRAIAARMSSSEGIGRWSRRTTWEIVIAGAVLTLLLVRRLGREDQAASAVALLLWSTAGAMLMAVSQGERGTWSQSAAVSPIR